MRPLLPTLAAACAVGCQAQADVYYQTFSTALSQASISAQERSVFSHTLSEGATHGVITHWWITGGLSTDFAILRFYIDGETSASIVVQPGMACGVGFDDDTQAPWSNTWFGKGAKSGGWFNNMRIPFQASINVTYTAGPGQPDDVIYMIVRGAENLPINVGGVPVPTSARLNVQVTNMTLQPLEFAPVAAAPRGTNGVLALHTLSFTAPNLNSLEGCYHAYTPGNASFPGMLLSSGTEDYFDSAYYFNGGKFTGENAGFTHIDQNASVTTFSAYRMHMTDPVTFRDGFRMDWRNGDVSDPATGLKCTQLKGNTVGNPGPATVLAYSWFYTWN